MRGSGGGWHWMTWQCKNFRFSMTSCLNDLSFVTTWKHKQFICPNQLKSDFTSIWNINFIVLGEAFERSTICFGFLQGSDKNIFRILSKKCSWRLWAIISKGAFINSVNFFILLRNNSILSVICPSKQIARNSWYRTMRWIYCNLRTLPSNATASLHLLPRFLNERSLAIRWLFDLRLRVHSWNISWRCWIKRVSRTFYFSEYVLVYHSSSRTFSKKVWKELKIHSLSWLCFNFQGCRRKFE